MRPRPLLTALLRPAIPVLAAVLLLLPAAEAAVQDPLRAAVRGRVVDAAGAPCPWANVQIVGSLDGSLSDRDGHFFFTTSRTGPQQVRASFIGYEPAVEMVTIAPGDTLIVRLVLRSRPIQMETVKVTTEAFTTGEGEGVTMQPLEVVTTPGAAADIFLAMKTFPGVAMVDEGAGLFVRGGDIDETVILLDQATVAHPYRFETPTGGVFGTIPPFLVSGTYFSTGGFGARYGNALSGVLAMESMDMPAQRQVYLNAGLAAVSAGTDQLLAGDRVGIRFSGNVSNTEQMFRVNGMRGAFSTTPRGSDGNLSLIWRYSPTGRLKFFNFAAKERIGVYVDEPSFAGIYRGESLSTLHSLQLIDLKGGWFLKAGFSASRYGSRRRLGNLDLEPADVVAKLRVDAERPLPGSLQLYLGAEVERATNRFRGTVPEQGDVLDPDAPTLTLDERYAATRTGIYTELDVPVGGAVTLNAGVRSDHHALADETTVDPRLGVRWRFAPDTDLRLATGIYHAFPSPYEFNPSSGNPDLGSKRANHYIAGIQRVSELTLLRLEAYHKPYRRLVLEHPDTRYANVGEATADGVDLFARYGEFLLTPWNGWISYSYLRSDRLQARHVGDQIEYASGPSPYDITHNLTVVGKVRLVGFLSGGFTWRWATGRPVTPITGALADPGGSFWLPIEGTPGSERLPPFQRLDADLSYFHPFGSGSSAVFYLGISNLLDRRNVLGYEYSADYSERRERRTDYRRFFYIGFTVNLVGRAGTIDGSR